MVAANDIWAKGSPDGVTPGELLVDHTINVVKRIGQLRARAPFLPGHCGDSRLWHRLALAAAIHDLGKCDPRFQFVLRENKSDKLRSNYGHRHEVLSLAWLDWVLGDDPHNDRFAIGAAVASHHRNHSEIKLKYSTGEVWNPAPNIPDFVAPVPQNLFAQIAELFLTEILPKVRPLGLLDEDWVPPRAWSPSENDRHIAIKSLRRNLTCWEEWMEEADGPSFDVQHRLHGFFLRGLIMLADHAGSADIDFRPLPILSSTSSMSSRLSPKDGKTYYPHQDQAAEAIGHTIMVAPTGSGKTEAALRWASKQYESSSGSPPLFYVLPFKASMNAMQTRIVDRVSRESLESETRLEFVSLQHSSAVQVLYHQLMSDDSGRSARHAEWIVRRQRNLAKLHATPIRILSPYQLLRAAYQLKGHEAIWTDACGGVMILDEIHAYDPARIARILEMLRFLVERLGARVLVMTATMPSIVHERLVQLLHNPTLIRARDSTFEEFRRHRLQLRDSGLLESTTVREIADHVRNGEAVLCVATTVARAQQLRELLQRELENTTKVRLLHSRFTTHDRAYKEEELRKLVSTELRGVRTEQVVLVATQVVEVSLDVDFDVLFTDPAPLEALLQRFGRVNRSRRPEPHDVIVCTRIGDALPVYHEVIVTAAIKQLRLVENSVIDESEVQKWLDAIYAGPIGQWLAKAIEAESKDFARILAALKPFEANDELEKMFYEQFDGAEVVPESLVEQYRDLLESEPFRASSLAVPISNRQLNTLRRKGLVREPAAYKLPIKSPFVVIVPYDSESGLALNPPPDQETT